MRPQRSLRAPLPVLALSAYEAEWLPSSDEEPGARVVHDVRRPAELASVARQAWDKATRSSSGRGRSPGACLLALGPAFVHERLIELPALPARDRREVLRRKAASLVHCGADEVAFSASLQMKASGKGELDRWLILAVRRSEIEELFEALRARGFRVVRTVSTRMGPVREALSKSAPRSNAEGLVVIAVEPRSTTVSLVAGSALISQSSLTGNLSAQPGLARSLMQEVRSLDIFLRKGKRARHVTEIAWVGLADGTARLLRKSLSNALPEAQVLSLIDTTSRSESSDRAAERHSRQEVGLDLGRRETLAACRSESGFVQDPPVRPPRRRAAVAARFGLALLVCLLSALLLNDRLTEGLGELERALERLGREEHETRRALVQAAEAREDIESLRAQLLRADRARHGGVPFEALVEDTLAAFGDRGALASLTLDHEQAGEGGGSTMVVTGWTDPDPVRSARHVEGIAKALERRRGPSAIQVDPPAELPIPAGDGALRPMSFTLRARWEEAEQGR